MTVKKKKVKRASKSDHSAEPEMTYDGYEYVGMWHMKKCFKCQSCKFQTISEDAMRQHVQLHKREVSEFIVRESIILGHDAKPIRTMVKAPVQKGVE